MPLRTARLGRWGMKKVHMVRIHFSVRDAETVALTLCKIHRRTWAYKQTSHWDRVTCEVCLLRRKLK